MYSILLDPESKKDAQTTTDSFQFPAPIVFPYDKKSRSFDRTFYYSGLTDRRASYEDIHHFLLQIEVLVHNKLKAVRFLTAFYVSFALLTFALVLFFDFTTASNHLISLVTLGYFVLMIICGVATLMLARQKYKSLRALTQEIVDNHREMFATVGLRWLLPANFPMQIELYKDYEALDFESSVSRRYTDYREGAQRQSNGEYHPVNILNYEIGSRVGL